MIAITPTQAQLEEAAADAKKMGVLPGSFTGGRGNKIGMLAEIIAADWTKAVRVRPPVYSHDLELNGKTADVKAKRCSSVPLPEYTASVVAPNGKHTVKADIILFSRVLDDMSEVYLCGWLTRLQFLRRAELIKAGTRDGGFIHRVTGLHVPISRLNSMESLIV